MAVVAAVPLSLRVFMRPHIEAMASRYAVTMISSAGGEVISEQVLGTRFFAVDIRREISPLADLCSLFHLFVLFRREKFALVHSLTPKAGLLTMLAAFLSRVPVRIHIFTGQVWVTRKGLGRSLLKALDRLIAMLATHVLADSHSQRRFLIAEGVVCENRIQVLADGSICGVDSGRFRPDSEVRQRIRQELQIPDDALVILFLGRLTRDKGVLDLAQAFAMLAADHRNLYLAIVGPDEVAEGETGLLHEAGSVEGLFSALRTLVGDERLCRQMGVTARDRALTKYSVQRLVAAQMAFYQTLLGEISGGTNRGAGG